MSSRTTFLAKLMGLFLIGMAAALFVNEASMVAAVGATVREPELLLAYSVVSLAAGLALVIKHNRWRGGAATIIVTLVGWALLIKSLLLLFAPTNAIISLYGFVRFGDLVYGYAAVIALIGLYLTYSGFSSAAARRRDKRRAPSP